MIDKEAQLKNLEWMSNTLLKIASNKSLSLDQQLKLIKDLKKEYFDLKASIKLESAGGLTYPLVMDMTKEQLMALPTISQSQFDNLKFDDGKHRVWVSRMTVEDGALEDNQVHFETLQNGNWIEAALKKSKTRKCNMCKEEFDPKGSPILRCPKCFDKTADLKAPVTEPTKLLVFKREFLATPLKDQQKFGGYEISKNGKKLFKINSSNSQPMSKEQIEFCAQIELTRGLKQAKLTEKIAFLDAGSTVYILAADKPQKRIKFASMEHGIRGWAPVSKFAFLAKEAEMRKHNDHIDNTYGHNGKEILVDCPNGSGNMVWLPINELLPIEAPPATPESLNEDLGKDSAAKCPKCKGEGRPGMGSCPECGGYATDIKEQKQSAKECPDCHGNFEGAEGATCPTCGRFSVQKEALRPALTPQILNRRQEVNASTTKAADPKWNECASCNKVFKLNPNQKLNHSYCPECHKLWPVLMDGHDQGTLTPEQEQKLNEMNANVGKHFFGGNRDKKPSGKTDPSFPSSYRNEIEDPLEHMPESLYNAEASLNKVATVVHRTDGWHVLSEKGKNLGGPYKNKSQAIHRLKQVEWFKHHGILRPFSKQVYAEVLTDPYQTLSTHITEMRTRMDQVNERLQNAPAVKTAKEDAAPEMDLAALFADLTQGIDLLETKLGGDDIEPELHKGVEELENKLWTLEEKLGLTPKLSEHEKAEPEHKKIVEDIDKEAGRRSYCEKCDKQISHGRFCDKCKEKEVKKEAAVVTDETIEETTNDPSLANPSLTPIPPPTPGFQNIQPTDNDNLEISVPMPTSPPPPGQKWQFNSVDKVYVLMPDTTNPAKLV